MYPNSGVPDPQIRQQVAKIAMAIINDFATQQNLHPHIVQSLQNDAQNIGGFIVSTVMQNYAQTGGYDPYSRIAINFQNVYYQNVIVAVINELVQKMHAALVASTQQQAAPQQQRAPVNMGYDTVMASPEEIAANNTKSEETPNAPPVEVVRTVTFVLGKNDPDTGTPTRSSDLIVQEGIEAFTNRGHAVNTIERYNRCGFVKVHSADTIDNDLRYRLAKIDVIRPMNSMVEMLNTLTKCVGYDIISPDVNYSIITNYETINQLDVPREEFLEIYRVLCRTGIADNIPELLERMSETKKRVYTHVSALIVREINRRISVCLHMEDVTPRIPASGPHIAISDVDDLTSLISIPGLERLCSQRIYQTKLSDIVHSALYSIADRLRGNLQGNSIHHIPRGRLLDPRKRHEVGDILATTDLIIDSDTICIDSEGGLIQEAVDTTPEPPKKDDGSEGAPFTPEELSAICVSKVVGTEFTITNRDFAMLTPGTEAYEAFIKILEEQTFITQRRTMIITNAMHPGIIEEVTRNGYYFTREVATPFERIVYDHLIATEVEDCMVEVVVFSKARPDNVVEHRIIAGMTIDGRLCFRKSI